MITVSHTKTNSITDWTQADLDAQIALGNFPAGTLLANIVLPSDWNHSHTITFAGRTVTGATATMTDSDGIVNVNRAGAVAITGAAGRTAWKEYTIKDASGAASTNNITYTPASGTINGAASILIQQNYDSLTIYSDGTNEFTK